MHLFFVLGIYIHRDRNRGILGLSQNNYIDTVLGRFGMKYCSLRDPPITKGDKFSLSQYPKNELEQKEMHKFPYGLTVRSLMYAQVCTHLDIAYIIGMLGTYLSNLGMDHWKATKWVMWYLQSEVLYNNRLSIRSYSVYPEVKKDKGRSFKRYISNRIEE